MAWGKNGTPDTLTSAGDTLTISDLTTTKFNQFMSHVISSSTIDIDITFDNNTATDYARRQSYNGGSDSTNTSQSNIQYSNNVTDTEFMIMYGVNINSEEKLFIMFQNRSNTAGAGNAPNRYEMVAKIDTTTNTGQYTRVDINNTEAGSYDTNSNLSAIGSDITPAAAVPFPTNVQVGSRAEITDTRKMYNLKEQPTPESTATYQVTDASGTQGLYTGSYYISAEKVKSMLSYFQGESLIRFTIKVGITNIIVYPIMISIVRSFLIFLTDTIAGRFKV